VNSQDGGGMDMKAYGNIYEKYGMADEQVYDEADDEDWELVGNEEDDLTFAMQSIAYKSQAAGGAASKAGGVTFTKGTKDTVLPSALKLQRGRLLFRVAKSVSGYKTSGLVAACHPNV